MSLSSCCCLGLGLLYYKPIVASVIKQQILQSEANERLEDRASALEQSRGKLRGKPEFLNLLKYNGDALIVVDENVSYLFRILRLIGYLQL